MNDMPSSERWILGFLLAVAILTFFFPLASLQVPILGNQDVSGYELIAKAKDFNGALDAVKSKEINAEGFETSQPAPNDSDSVISRSPIPLSVQALPLIPIEIIISFGCALIALFCCLGPFGSAPAKAFSSLGAVAAVAALLHLTIANSDLHTWFRELMKADSSALANNPFAGFAQQIENLAINSIQLRPGPGLYALASTLSLAAIILLSKVFSSSPSNIATEPYPDQSNGSARTFAIFVLLLALLAIAVVVLVHESQTGSKLHDSAQSSAPVTGGGSIATTRSAVPFVGFKSDGQTGPVEAPKGRAKVVMIDAEAVQRLAYYESTQGFGVLAPRGWYCFGTYGSGGDALYVSPQPISSADLFSSTWSGFGGPVIELSLDDGGTSGRFGVAQTIARVFPAHRDFVRNVIAEGIEPASSFPFGPYPNDDLVYRSNEIVEYKTPAQKEGLGTSSGLQINAEPISGVAILIGEDTNLLKLSVRLSSYQTDLTSSIIHQVERDAARK
jgi:hypothetical protein